MISNVCVRNSSRQAVINNNIDNSNQLLVLHCYIAVFPTASCSLEAKACSLPIHSLLASAFLLRYSPHRMIEKLKSTLAFSSAGNKLSKVFKFNLDRNVLKRSNERRVNMENPFADKYDYEEVGGRLI